MNLIVRITLLFVFVSLIVFGIGGLISYRVMMREVEHEQKGFLMERLDRMEDWIEKYKPKKTLEWNKLTITPMEEYQEDSRAFSDTTVMHVQLNRLEPHLRLDAIRNIDSVTYSISMYDVIIEEDDIKDGVVESLVTMYIILLAAVLIIGLGASYYILRPFNLTLTEIRKFSIKDPGQTLHFPKSNVSEFKRLNKFLTEMTQKVKSDYNSLKEFSENASHEFQTPIAIIQSKLEVLMDGENLTEEQLEQISYVQNATRRLSNLSNSLALLTKIENKEFANVSDVNVSEALSNLVEEFKELFDLKKLKVEVSIEKDQLLQADKVLIELLLTNLMNNSIRHNWEGGRVDISLQDKSLKISNTGPAISFSPDELFRRFKKTNQSAESMGLGLAIVKKVCDFYEYHIKYDFSDKMHTIKIDF